MEEEPDHEEPYHSVEAKARKDRKRTRDKALALDHFGRALEHLLTNYADRERKSEAMIAEASRERDLEEIAKSPKVDRAEGLTTMLSYLCDLGAVPISFEFGWGSGQGFRIH